MWRPPSTGGVRGPASIAQPECSDASGPRAMTTATLASLRPLPGRLLRVQPAEPGCLGDALDGDGLGGKSRLDPVRDGTCPDGVGGRQDLAVQPLVDLIERPGD